MKKTITTIFLLAFALFSINAKIIYVTTTGSDENDGSTWENAKLTPAHAYTKTKDGDSILIAAGTYEIPTAINVNQNRSVSILGGYHLTESGEGIVGERPMKANGKPWEYEYETILKAIEYVGKAANSRIIHVLASSIDGEILIEGLTFKEGRGKYNNASWNELGGAICQQTSTFSKHKTIIKNCKFINNGVTKIENSVGGMGGAIHLRANALVENCYFNNNYANDGSSGGGAIYAQAGNDQIITISKCIFDSNKTNKSGGAIRTNSSRVTPDNTVTGKVIIDKCHFYNNIAVDGEELKAGAAIYVNGVSAKAPDPALASIDEITNSLFYNNSGTQGILISGTTIKNCTYVNNIGSIRYNMPNAGILHNVVIWGNKLADGTNSGVEFGISGKNIPIEVGNWASNVKSKVDNNGAMVDFDQANLSQIKDFVFLNDNNLAADGPNFISPSTAVGVTEFTETPNWGIAENSPLKNAGKLVNAPGSTDLAGISRPSSGNSCAIGAYESSGLSALKNLKDLGFNVKILNNEVEITNENPSYVVVFSINGQLVKSSNYATSHRIQLNQGLYLAKIQTSNGTQTIKILIP